MSAIDELFATWRNNPSAALTIALCSELGESKRGDMAREVGSTAETWHAKDLDVMLAVGRMYLDCSMLPDAQAALVAAGKLDPEDPRPFRMLAETLLCRGDAVRAEKVLARAQALGAADAVTRAIAPHIPSLVALQKKSGVLAVANEAKRLLASRAKVRPVRGAPPRGMENGRAALPRFESEDPIEISEVFERDTTAGQGARVLPRGASSRAPQANRRRQESSSDDITEIMRDGLSELEEVSVVDAAPLPSFEEAANGGGSVPDALPAAPLARAAVPLAHGRRRGAGASVAPAPLRSAPPSLPSSPAALRSVPPPAPLRSVPPSLPSPSPPPPRSAPPNLPSAAPPVPMGAPSARSGFGASPLQTPAAPTMDHRAPPLADSASPSPALIFEHLARVGVFEPSGGAAPAWEAPPRQRSRGVIPLLIGCILLTGAGVGGYEYSRRVKAERMEQAAQLNAEVERLLRSGRVADLKSTDEKLGRAFDLDSRSQRAGRLWLENRVLGALLLAEETRGIDSAVHRGRAAGLPEKDLAVGRIASFLAEGDVAGAAALLPKWDKESGTDALYQVAAGAALERAGDPRAVERYEAARRLDPKLVVADLLLARLLLLEYGPERAKATLDGLAAKGADPVAVRALSALAWVVDPERSTPPPENARLTEAEAKQLPAPLAAIPAMFEAVEAMLAGERQKVASALERAIALAQGPALPATLGFLAIDSGDAALARKAALRALSFAALYPRARTLAARVALLGGRIEEAQKAVEELDPKSADVAVVRAVVAYETADVPNLEEAIQALGPTDATPAFAALAAAPGVLTGSRLPAAKALAAFASPSVPWGRIVALDAALDTANLALAEELVTKSPDGESPVELLRVARLRRYQKKTEDALAASERAFAGKPTTALVVERVYELIDANQIPAARDLVAKYPSVLGPVTAWLGVLLDVAVDQPQKAAVRLATLEPPPDEAPTFLRVLAARALAAAHDKRARAYVLRVARRLGKHPDVILAAEALK